MELIQRTVTATRFRVSRRDLVKDRNEKIANGIPCGRIYATSYGWKFKYWHSGPKVNLA